MSRKVALKQYIPPPSFRSPETGTRFRLPNKYTPQLARKICEQLMLGKSLKQICAQPNFPTDVTVVRWLANPAMTEFREQYYYARRVAAELRVDEIFEIADDTSKDYKEIFNAKGESMGYKPDNEAIQRSRVRIDTRKWYAAKMVPRLYGDKLDVELDVTGDLAELLKSAKNQDTGLPKPINGEVIDEST